MSCVPYIQTSCCHGGLLRTTGHRTDPMHAYRKMPKRRDQPSPMFHITDIKVQFFPQRLKLSKPAQNRNNAVIGSYVFMQRIMFPVTCQKNKIKKNAYA